jgi:MFS family permease
VTDKLLMGWLNDKVGVRLTVLIQLVMVILGFLGFIFLSQNPVLLLIAAFFFGVQNSLVSVSTPLLIRQIFGERDFTQIYAYARIGTGLIGCLGPVTVGYLYDWSGSFNPAFGVGIGICLVGLVVVRIAYVTRKKLVWEG